MNRSRAAWTWLVIVVAGIGLLLAFMPGERPKMLVRTGEWCREPDGLNPQKVCYGIFEQR